MTSSHNIRRLALEILEKVESGAYSNLVLNRQLDQIADKRDRALLTELVYGVIRYKSRLDFLIAQAASRPPEKIDHLILAALRLGFYQLIFLDRIPARAAVYETVSVVKGLVNRGGVGFTNAVLRGFLRRQQQGDEINYPAEPRRYLSIYYSHPEWLVDYWLERYGYDRTRRLLAYNNRTPQLHIRHNDLRVSQERLMDGLAGRGIEVESSPVPGSYIIFGYNNVTELPYFQEGGVIVQGSAAVLAGHILSPEPGMRVLDMAAGPGGKTTHLGQLMGNRGEIVALDIYEHKLKLIEENCRKTGVDIVETHLEDGRKYRTDRLFDMVLMDAPCSGLGLVSQKPEIKWNKQAPDLVGLHNIQLELMQNALRLLKPGGTLLYSTCTLTREENEGLVEDFLSRNDKGLVTIELAQDLARLGLAERYQTGRQGYLELFPPESNTEGFFMAKFLKQPGSGSDI